MVNGNKDCDLTVKTVVVFDEKHGYYKTKRVLEKDTLLSDFSYYHECNGCYIEILYKRVTSDLLDEGITELYMTGKLGDKSYTEEDKQVIMEVYQMPLDKRKELYNTWEQLFQVKDMQRLEEWGVREW